MDGLFGFTTAFTQRNPLSADTTSGNAIASFLLGYPASGSTDVNPGDSYTNKFAGLYIQDDFRVTPKLMLNLGLRWDVQTPTTERYNRILNGFEPTLAYPLGASQAMGGVTFASNSDRQAWNTHYRDFQPRVGVAYQFTPKLWVTRRLRDELPADERAEHRPAGCLYHRLLAHYVSRGDFGWGH